MDRDVDRAPSGDPSRAEEVGHAALGDAGQRRSGWGLDAYKAAFRRALDRQDEELVRLAAERLEASRRTAATVDACRNWAELAALKDRWAEGTGDACLVAARWLALHADLIRHPEWLRRQLPADGRSEPRRPRA